MREIKYRIWDKKYEEYIEDSDFVWSLTRKGKIYDSRNDEWSVVGERYIVEFFTGLKNSKGVDIFEGDIIQWGSIALKVYCDKGSFMAGDHYLGRICLLSEIIGNVHQHPELINNK